MLVPFNFIGAIRIIPSFTGFNDKLLAVLKVTRYDGRLTISLNFNTIGYDFTAEVESVEILPLMSIFNIDIIAIIVQDVFDTIFGGIVWFEVFDFAISCQN